MESKETLSDKELGWAGAIRDLYDGKDVRGFINDLKEERCVARRNNKFIDKLAGDKLR